MRTAIIGYTGFVGSHLAKMYPESDMYNSKNINDIRGMSYDVVYNAGVPGTMWKANLDSKADEYAIALLLFNLQRCDIKKIIHISTAEVYGSQTSDDGASESTRINRVKLHLSSNKYGFNRLVLEDSIVRDFPNHLIVRLTSLFGDGLRKNALYDLLNNRLDQIVKINGNDWYQWFPISELGKWIDCFNSSRCTVVNLVPEPIVMSTIVMNFFPEYFKNIASRVTDNKHYRLSSSQTLDNNVYHISAEDVMSHLKTYIDAAKQRGYA